MIQIRSGSSADIPLLYNLYSQIGKKDDGYFEEVFAKNITVLIAEDGSVAVGFCLLNFEPRYSLYRRMNIPEIQDLNVIPSARRRGIATSLIAWCENLARARGHADIGISVGLFKDYGPAQILYSRLGFMPDGNGVTYDREGVTPYTSYLLDDNLSLMMVKAL